MRSPSDEKMRFFIRMTERECRDAQERSALLRHRLNAIRYQQALLDQKRAHYAFYPQGKPEAYLMYMVDSLVELDFLIKRDPYFPYTRVTVTPVINTEALVIEAQDYLGVDHFSKDEIASGILDCGIQPIDPDAEYWMAWKEVPPFSPLLGEAEQNDVHYRTIVAQEGHFNDIEFADDNPVGMQVGLALAKGPLAAFQAVVEVCPVYPDTRVEYTRLLTLKMAWRDTVEELARLRRPVPPEEAGWPFEAPQLLAAGATSR